MSAHRHPTMLDKVLSKPGYKLSCIGFSKINLNFQPGYPTLIVLLTPLIFTVIYLPKFL